MKRRHGLHMSGHCLCGAYAQHGEIHGLELLYPAVEMHNIEAYTGSADPRTAPRLAPLGRDEVSGQIKFQLYAGASPWSMNWSSCLVRSFHASATGLRLARSRGNCGSSAASPGARTRP